MDNASRPRITDFSQAIVTQCLDYAQVASDDQRYAVRWTAPEILTGEGIYSKEADIFSFAMVMIEVCHEWPLPIGILLTDISYNRCSLA